MNAPNKDCPKCQGCGFYLTNIGEHGPQVKEMVCFCTIDESLNVEELCHCKSCYEHTLEILKK